jgi:O-antigen ligase
MRTIQAKRNDQKLFNLIIVSAIINTLIITPFVNKDGMIIPKLMVIFMTAMFLLPIIFFNFRIFLGDKILRITLIIVVFILLQALLVIYFNEAPMEQQIFGRTGRGLGLILIFSILIVFLCSALLIRFELIEKLLFSLILGAFISSFYSILQSFGLDLISWDTRTNGVIGTLGNPNFQSAFAAMALVPSLLFFLKINRNFYLSMLIPAFLCFVIIRTKSTQGVIAALVSFTIVSLIYFWYRDKRVFGLTLLGSVFGGVFAIFGMLGHGPFAQYLYKVSVQSRGDFWRSAFATANDNPFFGVGLDSFGDYSLKYRDQIAAGHPWAEYTDNAHNFFLQQAATAGYPFAILNLLLIILVLFSFFSLQRSIGKFEPRIVSVFSVYVVFQMISVISPENLVNLYWNTIFSGALVGLVKISHSSSKLTDSSQNLKVKKTHRLSLLSAVLSIVIMLPLFTVDKNLLTGMKSGNANQVMSATLSYPESTIRYNLIGRELFDSGLTKQSLEIARSGIKFNPNSAALWALILVNPHATLNERLMAKSRILELDPLNKNVREYNIP